MPAKMSKEYAEGKKAAKYGLKATDNPYKSNVSLSKAEIELYKQWLDGYINGKTGLNTRSWANGQSDENSVAVSG